MKLQSKTIRVLLVFLFTLFISGFSQQEIKANDNSIYGKYVYATTNSRLATLELYETDNPIEKKTIQYTATDAKTGAEIYLFEWINKRKGVMSTYIITRFPKEERYKDRIVLMNPINNNMITLIKVK